MNRTLRRPFTRLASIFVSAVLLAACDEGNGWTKDPVTPDPKQGGGAVGDTVRPTVTLNFPTDSAVIAVGDSVFVEARVTDNQRLGTLKLEGYAVRGNRDLGTEVLVPRFTAKTVEFKTTARKDTVITRYLVATRDSTQERRVRIVATASDSTGNLRVDTAYVNIGGPRAEVLAPVQNDSFPAGGQLPVRVLAEDANDLIRSVIVRMTGPFAREVAIPVAVPRARVDTTISVPIPAPGTGTETIQVVATSGSNIQAVSRPVSVRITPVAADRTAPQVTFTVDTTTRRQATDSVRVAVMATDEVGVDSVGATLRVRYRDPASGNATERHLTARVAGASGTVWIPFGQLGLAASDTVTLAVEVTGWAVDAAANCGAAVTPGTPQRLACALAGGAHVANGVPGKSLSILVTRGSTVLFSTQSDTIADLASDGRSVFASNITANRVEVLPVAATAFGTPFSVGSRPWGLAIGASGDSLLVANSGGTNISVVAIPSSGTPREVRRIRTADVELYDVVYDVKTDSTRSVTVMEYSDRPQYLGQLSTGQILYSTRPTDTGHEGTVRIYDGRKDTSYEFNRGSEIFTGYAQREAGRAIVVNALTAGRALNSQLGVCPRRLRPEQTDPACVVGLVNEVAAALTQLRSAGRTDTRLDVGVSAPSLGLQDTTFVATSTQRNAVAFGEGDKDFGRILYFQIVNGNLVGTSRESDDLVQNASDRVIGLGLNSDGSLGVARGNQVYFFDSSLRLAGVARSGSPTGGSAMHPLNAGYPANDGRRLGFTSGVDASGPYIDVLDTFNFEPIRRLPVRDRVTGSVIAVPVPPGDPEAGTYVVRLFALTPSGILRVGLTQADLRR